MYACGPLSVYRCREHMRGRVCDIRRMCECVCACANTHKLAHTRTMRRTHLPYREQSNEALEDTLHVCVCAPTVAPLLLM